MCSSEDANLSKTDITNQCLCFVKYLYTPKITVHMKLNNFTFFFKIFMYCMKRQMHTSQNSYAFADCVPCHCSVVSVTLDIIHYKRNSVEVNVLQLKLANVGFVSVG